MKLLKTAALAASTLALLAGTAMAQTTNLRIQTHYGPETAVGQERRDVRR